MLLAHGMKVFWQLEAEVVYLYVTSLHFPLQPLVAGAVAAGDGACCAAGPAASQRRGKRQRVLQPGAGVMRGCTIALAAAGFAAAAPPGFHIHGDF